MVSLPWKQISTAPAAKDQPRRENFLTKILHPYRKYGWGEGLKCVFYFPFFRFSPNVDKNFAFFYTYSKGSEELQKFFFKIFEQFFAELWRLKHFEWPSCYEIPTVQWNFFPKKLLFIHKYTIKISKSFERWNIVKKNKNLPTVASCLAHRSSSHFPRYPRGKFTVFTGLCFR